MSALPILYDHIAKLIKFLLTNKQEDRDEVVILFQDMHEVATRDIMEDQLPNLDGSGYDKTIRSTIPLAPKVRNMLLFLQDLAIHSFCHGEEATNKDPPLYHGGLGLHIVTFLRLSCSMVGRAAMIGFFMAYLVDVLMCGRKVVDLFETLMGVILFRQTKSRQDLKNLADEAISYDKQWQDQDEG
ncbi:hypothetical protein Ccrd_012196, partial [Cynara cardunculus var. scolymus]